jgi:hypothetical protein
MGVPGMIAGGGHTVLNETVYVADEFGIPAGECEPLGFRRRRVRLTTVGAE